MSKIAIRVENLSKRYEIGVAKQRHDTLRDQLADAAKSLIRRNGRNGRSNNTLWALKNLSFEIKQGEVVGVIGRNGSGKSTLLKILSRITVPTEGKAEIYGRIGSLLEVGTGFHPELTGRENIYLSGAILGMRKTEIKRKFDEIVAFAETEKFIDTPVKRYSSGMYVRLAFAVAAHLETDILLVDEVLAVGDAEFQKKCLAKMSDVAREGRTLLFVSHSMAAVAALCQKGIFLLNGNLNQLGTIDAVIQKYLNLYHSEDDSSLLNHSGRAKGLKPHISQIRILGGSSKSDGLVLCGDRCEIILKTISPFSTNARFAITIYDTLGTPISHLNTELVKKSDNVSIGPNEIHCQIEQLNLAPGTYYINAAYHEGNIVLDHITQARRFRVIESNFLGMGKLPSSSSAKVVLKHEWQSR